MRNVGLILADRASWDRIGRRRRPSSTAPGLPSGCPIPEEWPGAITSVYRIRYQRDPLVHGDEEPSASSQYEQYIWHCYLVGRPHAGTTALDLGRIVAGLRDVHPELRSGFYAPVTAGRRRSTSWFPSTMIGTWRFRKARRNSLRRSGLYAEKRGGPHVMELARLGCIDIFCTPVRRRDDGERE